MALGYTRVYANSLIYGEGSCLVAWGPGPLVELETEQLRSVTWVIHVYMNGPQEKPKTPRLG